MYLHPHVVPGTARPPADLVVGIHPQHLRPSLPASDRSCLKMDQPRRTVQGGRGPLPADPDGAGIILDYFGRVSSLLP